MEQVLSSLSSGLLLLSLVAITAPEIFGAVSLVYVISQLALAVLRFAAFLPLHTKGTEIDLSSSRLRANAALSIVAGVAVGAVATMIATLVFHTFTAEAALVAVWTPILFANEALRQTALARSRFTVVILASAAWTALAVLGFMLSLLQVTAPLGVICIWGAGAVLSLLILAVRRTAPGAVAARVSGSTGLSSGRSIIPMLAPHLPSRSYLAFGSLIPTSIVVLQLCVARSGGSTTYGELAANTLAWTPIAVMLAGLPVLTSHLRGQGDPGVLRTICRGVALAIIPVVVWALVLMLLSGSVLPLVLGASADVVPTLLPGSIALWAMFVFQSFMLTMLLQRGDDRGAVWVGIVALIARGILGLALITHPDLQIQWYVAAEALAHAILAAALILRSVGAARPAARSSR